MTNLPKPDHAVDYDHARNSHSPESPRWLLPVLFEERKPSSLLDVGCGRGVWLNAALELGVSVVTGLDGVDIPAGDLLFPQERFHLCDLDSDWNMGRKFDAILCLEVAEHLESKGSARFIRNLTAHSDLIYFSAACPGQPGQRHVNCQWPEYWQQLFNQAGYSCDDALRWRVWNDSRIEPWYRQNLFVAMRNPIGAGSEARIQRVIHPDFLPAFLASAIANAAEAERQSLSEGNSGARWYLKGLEQRVKKKLTGEG